MAWHAGMMLRDYILHLRQESEREIEKMGLIKAFETSNPTSNAAIANFFQQNHTCSYKATSPNSACTGSLIDQALKHMYWVGEGHSHSNHHNLFLIELLLIRN